MFSRGDQVLEVDSVSLRHAALSEAYAILSECGPGPVSLIISRHPNPKVRLQKRYTHKHTADTLKIPQVELSIRTKKHFRYLLYPDSLHQHLFPSLPHEQ